MTLLILGLKCNQWGTPGDLFSVSVWKRKVERLISKNKREFLRMLCGTQSYCWFFFKRSSFAMVLLRTVPLASWLPLGLRMVFQNCCPYITPHPTLPDTPASKVPRAGLVSGSGGWLSLLLALIPTSWAGQLFSSRFLVPCSLPGIPLPWMWSWKKICLRWPKAIVIRLTSVKIF